MSQHINKEEALKQKAMRSKSLRAFLTSPFLSVSEPSQDASLEGTLTIGPFQNGHSDFFFFFRPRTALGVYFVCFEYLPFL